MVGSSCKAARAGGGPWILELILELLLEALSKCCGDGGGGCSSARAEVKMEMVS